MFKEELNVIFHIHNLLRIDIDEDFPWFNDWEHIFRDFTLINLRNDVTERDVCKNSCEKNIEISYCGKNFGKIIRHNECCGYPAQAAIYSKRDKIFIKISDSGNLKIFLKRPCLEWVSWILQIALLENNACLIHGGTVVKNGQATTIVAEGGTGKTTIIYNLVKRYGFDFMGDDYSILALPRYVYAFPKPMVIYAYHEKYLYDIFKSLKGSKMLTRFNLACLAKPIKYIFHPFPNLIQFLRRINPQSFTVNPSNVFEAEKLCGVGYLKRLLIMKKDKSIEELKIERVKENENPVEICFDITINDFNGMAKKEVLNAVKDIREKWNSILKKILKETDIYTIRLPLQPNYAKVTELICEEILNR